MLCLVQSQDEFVIIVAESHVASESASSVRRTRLGRLNIGEVVHLIELNDPVHFNAESSELISDLLLCLAYSD